MNEQTISALNNNDQGHDDDKEELKLHDDFSNYSVMSEASFNDSNRQHLQVKAEKQIAE